MTHETHPARLRGLMVGPGIEFPMEAVTEAFAYLGVRGSGKSNLARVVAEEMYDARVPFVAVDPVGSWYGLRSNREGTGPGLPVPIFGGEFGDWPVDKSGGAEVADMVVGENLSCVVDTSRFEDEDDRRGFLLAFARRLYHRNRRPRHLFLEEADDYLPQTGRGDLIDELIRAFVTIVRRGRQRGLGVTMITQRSAAISKDVLSQAGTLVAFRSTSPHDRDSIEKWLKSNTDAEARLADHLPTLENGEAILWSPNFLRLTRRVRFRLCRTFDSGKTATLESSDRPPATLADVDVAALGRRLAATVERAKAEDPALLRERIRELEAKVKARVAVSAPPTVTLAQGLSESDQWQVDTAARKIEEARRRAESSLVAASDTIARARSLLGEGLDDAGVGLVAAAACLVTIGTASDDLRRGLDVPDRGARPAAAIAKPAKVQPGGTGKPPTSAVPPLAEPGKLQLHRPPAAIAPGELDPTPPTPSEQRILEAIAWWGRINGYAGSEHAPTRHQAAWRAHYSGGGGRFVRLLASLVRKGLIEYPGDDRVQLAGRGPEFVRHEVGKDETDPAVLHADVVELLSPSEAKLLVVLARYYPTAVSFATLASEADYAEGGGRFVRLRSALHRYGLVEYPSESTVRLVPALMPGRRR